MASITASYIRRNQEWREQQALATLEAKMLEKQLLAAQARIEIAERELRNHETQLSNAKAVSDFMEEKYTSQELYGWMVTQLSTLYFQSYQLAYDVAKQAEKAWQHELARPDTSFIQFGYWDTLRKGLLAGERLQHDLERMEVSYLENDVREYELTQHVSLAMLDPVALIKLRQEGSCFFNLPEAIFDVCCPGHYLRRIKTVSLTIPCVAGPYSSINCTLTLLSSQIRTSTSTDSGYARTDTEDETDVRFRDETGVSQSVVTSSGQNDSGLFELNFNDPRYLPFERHGAISQWQLSLSSAWPQFDPQSISDVIVQLRYTAREGGETFRETATQYLKDLLNEMVSGSRDTGLMHLISVRHEFADEWYRFLHPADTDTELTLELELNKDHFPYAFQGEDIQVNRIWLLMILSDPSQYSEKGDWLELQMSIGGTSVAIATFETQTDSWDGQPVAEVEAGFTVEDSQTMEFVVAKDQLPEALATDSDEGEEIDPDVFDNLLLVLHYELKQ